jgi:hypothetical protein
MTLRRRRTPIDLPLTSDKAYPGLTTHTHPSEDSMFLSTKSLRDDSDTYNNFGKDGEQLRPERTMERSNLGLEIGLLRSTSMMFAHW